VNVFAGRHEAFLTEQLVVIAEFSWAITSKTGMQVAMPRRQ
jgi:hypothetical protein